MARFHKLTVTEIEKTTRDAVIVTLEPDDPDAFRFTQGQYLTFRRDFEGQDVRRSYSICTGVDDGVIQVGIKQVADGAFSNWANSEMKPGDVLEAMPPNGRFFTPLSKDNEKHYLGFAGGSGITPVLSILRTVLRREPNSRFTLVYANRGVGTIMFREELEDLKNLHMGRLNVLHILETDAQEIDLFTGRIDADKLENLFRHWIDIASVDASFICGPEPMMLTIADALKTHGLTDDQIKFELFKSDQPGRVARKATTTGSADSARSTKLTITMDGTTRTIEARQDQAVLDAALENALDAPYACRAGVCSTCRCKVLQGEVEMATNHALEDYEVRAGYVLSCQAFPLTDTVVVDYDQ